MKDVIADMTSPEGEKKLAGLASALKDTGSSTPAAEVMILAQKDSRTAGKSPDELVEMIKGDTSLVADLEGLAPGGEIDRAYKEMGVKLPGEKAPDEEEPAGDEAEEKSMGSFFEGSASMKGSDPKKGVEAKKAMGGKSPRKMGFDEKVDFMSRMAGE